MLIYKQRSASTLACRRNYSLAGYKWSDTNLDGRGVQSEHFREMSIAKQETWLATLLVLAFSSAWLVLVQADDDTTTMKLSEVVELLQPLGQSCDPIPEKEEVEEMVLNKEDPSYESKCFRRCLLEQFDVMPKGKQQYDANKTVDMMNMMFPEMEEQSTIITSKCNQAAGITDECEIAHSIAMCMLGEMRASNYKIPKVEE